MSESIAVIGLGYVGLPISIAFASRLGPTIGFDISKQRLEELQAGVDRTGEVDAELLGSAPLKFTNDPEDLRGVTFFVVTVPTPIDANRQPDLEPLRLACEIVGSVLQPGAVVVFESTVYPGVTEEFCGPILAAKSGLTQGKEFKLGYSPERINPGDTEHGLDRIVKVIAGEDDETTDRIVAVYSGVVDAGLHHARSIAVAEAAKVIENTQRDLNIALMNELALIFDRLNLRTKDVLDAAGTKWNFLKFTPGLVGGHCIGVDPYYLMAKAEAIGYHPEVIGAGRRINDNMGGFIGRRIIKLLIEHDHQVKDARVGILGLTFKENVPDFRNSKVFDVNAELIEYGIKPLLHDPLADASDVQVKGLTISPLEELCDLDALVLAVPHRHYLDLPRENLFNRIRPGGLFVDIKSTFAPEDIPESLNYWSL